MSSVRLMNDVRPTLILIVLVGIAVILAAGILSITDNQRTVICLDHPTYHQCENWQR
jgi:hypothetical protein